jgi:hypothetical protein
MVCLWPAKQLMMPRFRYQKLQKQKKWFYNQWTTSNLITKLEYKLILHYPCTNCLHDHIYKTSIFCFFIDYFVHFATSLFPATRVKHGPPVLLMCVIITLQGWLNHHCYTSLYVLQTMEKLYRNRRKLIKIIQNSVATTTM